MKVCFTTLFGDYDSLIDPVITSGWDYKCFTDQDIQSDKWEIIKLQTDNPRYFTRYIWHNPDEFFKADVSVKVNANNKVNCNLDELIEKYLKKDFAVTRHWFYKNVVEESEAILRCQQATPEAVKSAMDFLTSTKFPLENPLIALVVVMRRHNERTTAFFKELSNLVQSGCHREQLYFPYLLWKLKPEYDLIEDNLLNEFPIVNHK